MANEIKFFMDERVPPAVTHGLQLRSVRAETIIEVQKKLSQLLGLTPDESNGAQ